MLRDDITSHDIAAVLSEALPYMLRYENKTIVVKYGGHAMGDEKMASSFARNIVMLKQSGVNPVVVHGGGPQIGKLLERLNIKSEFRGGLRVTDKETVKVVEMVLAGSINKSIVAEINAAGGKAIGICGKDANICRVKKLARTERDPDSNIERIVDLGFVGDPAEINRQPIDALIEAGFIPVIAPLGLSESGDTYNINADTFAGAIAGAMKADRLLLLTDVPGVLDENKNLIARLSVEEVRALIARGVISGGMIPKVETCIEATELGVGGVVILDGKVPNAVLLELFTQHGAGTLIG
jgi:acetylglutamate kinase